MASLFARYIQEREGKRIIERDEGFATFQLNGSECYIEDIYVTPEARKSGVAASMADEISAIAKEAKCRVLLGSVVPSTNGSTSSLKVLLAYGFKLHRSEPNFIVLSKEL